MSAHMKKESEREKERERERGGSCDLQVAGPYA